MKTIDTLCEEFCSELLVLEPSLRAWWDKLVAAAGDENIVCKRWPTQISGHPRVLALFRKYYLEVARLSAETGIYVNPNSILISAAEDLGFDGICFVPIGQDDLDETSLEKRV